MTDPYFQPSGPHLVVRFDETEADILRRLLAEMRSLLEDGSRRDPAVERLFPDAYAEAEDAEAFRALVGDELLAGKLAALDRVSAVLEGAGAVQGTLGDEEAQSWLTALTDMRLAIGSRLEVTEEMMAIEIDPDDPHAFSLSVLHWLGWLQESLIAALDR